MAEHQLAHRYEGKAQGSFCRHPCAHSRRTTTANEGQGPATSARGGGLAHRRTQDVRREEILSRQPAGEDGPAHLGGHHQGEMDLRADSPTAERRTRSRSLRGTILARPSPSCAHDDDRICLPPASPPFNSKAGKNSSKAFRELVDFVARFRFYSPFNAMLIHTQMNGAKYAARAHRW